MVSQGEQRPGRPSTGLADDDVLGELSLRERRRMLRAMTTGRPLPPRLARAAVQYAPKLQHQAYLAYLIFTMGALVAGLAVWAGIGGRLDWWPVVSWSAFGVSLMLVGRDRLRATRRARQTVRDGYWPEESDHRTASGRRRR